MDPPKIYRPEHWRRRAEELRTAAEGMRHPSRSLWKHIADEYDLLAKRAEDRLRDHEPASGSVSPSPADDG
jgi:hypothetical protein